MRIDIHTHPLFKSKWCTYTTLDRFLREMDSSEMDKAVLLPIDSMPEQLDTALRDAKCRATFYQAFRQARKDSPGLTYAEFKSATRDILRFGMTNEVVHGLCSSHPDRFIGFGSVNPARPEREIEETIDWCLEWGFKGVKLMPTLMFFNPEEERMNIIYGLCQEKGLPILVHTGCDPEAWEYPSFSENANPKYLAKPAREHPDLKIIAAHMGSYAAYFPGLWWEEMMQVMEQCPNVYADLAALYSHNLFGKRQLLPKTIERVGYDRLLFGSDYPVMDRYPMHTAARAIDESDILDKKMKEIIMGETARTLLGL